MVHVVHSAAGYPVLSLLIFFPLLVALVLPFIRSPWGVRMVTLFASGFEILLALPLFEFRTAEPGFQFFERLPWMSDWGLSYALGIDGISLTMILLTVGLLPLCVLCSWRYIGARERAFHICLLLMTSACIGVFAALDFVLFYVFWEAMLVPMYLLIAVWGGPQRRYASIKFFLYTLAGSTLLLVAMVAFAHQGGTFFIPDLMAHNYAYGFQFWMFLAMALAFAIKVPMFPFHTWLPAAHVEAPAAGSVILASVLLKMGTYGFLRFCLGLTPAATVQLAPYFLVVSLVSILYGGLVALGQRDIKKLIAYSSVGHMGFATLGIFLLNFRGLEGSLLVMINHGITTGGLFMMIGLIYERSHSRDVADNQGLARALPGYTAVFGLFALSSLGFPGLNSFVGEAAALTGAFQYSPVVGFIAIPGAMLAAAYMLRLSLRLAFGQPSSTGGGHDHHGAAHGDDHGHGATWPDLKVREWFYLAPLIVLSIWFGLAPGPLLRTIDPPLERLLADVKAKAQLAMPAKVAQMPETVAGRVLP